MTSGAPILAFDTATTTCSVAVTRGGLIDGQVVGSISFDSGVTHSRRLLTAIDWLLETAGLTMTDISAVAVGTGPGSFTGLRIGMSTAKGLAHGSGLNMIGISSLDALAAPIRSDKLICVVMDARKREVYCCFYRCDQTGPPSRCSEPAVMAPDILASQITEPVTMAGDGVRVYSDVFVDRLGEQAELLPWFSAPTAVAIGYLASVEWAAQRWVDLDQATPDYVRSSDAQLSLVSPLKSGNNKR